MGEPPRNLPARNRSANESKNNSRSPLVEPKSKYRDRKRKRCENNNTTPTTTHKAQIGTIKKNGMACYGF